MSAPVHAPRPGQRHRQTQGLWVSIACCATLRRRNNSAADSNHTWDQGTAGFQGPPNECFRCRKGEEVHDDFKYWLTNRIDLLPQQISVHRALSVAMDYRQIKKLGVRCFSDDSKAEQPVGLIGNAYVLSGYSHTLCYPWREPRR